MQESAAFAEAEARKYGPRIPGGVLIAMVDTGSQAEEVGFQSNDIIVELNGKAVTSAEQLSKAVEANNGERYTIKIWRNGRYWTGEVGE